jgi:sugar-phosphatase
LQARVARRLRLSAGLKLYAAQIFGNHAIIVSMPQFSCKALLFDMDGTLIDSMDFAVNLYATWALSRGLDADHVVAIMPGVKTVEVVRNVAPHLDAEKERDVIVARELTDMTGVRAFPGTAELIASLRRDQWAIVTSAMRPGAEARLNYLRIAAPPAFITAEMVSHGKPAPDCFLLAAKKLDVDPRDCIVCEDAPSGVAAGKAAGMRVIAFSTTHSPAQLQLADAIVPSIAALRVEQTEDGLLVLTD